LIKSFIQNRLNKSCESLLENKLNKSFTRNKLSKSFIKNKLNKSSLALLFVFIEILSWEFLTFAFVILLVNNIKNKNKNKDAIFKILLSIVYINTFKEFNFRNCKIIIVIL